MRNLALLALTLAVLAVIALAAPNSSGARARGPTEPSALAAAPRAS
ncbi:MULTISPECIES: hypothetical protein [unclassified Phenylobacterium]|nr:MULTISPECIES: hypothetical protein [unclassified Phenylobacterium]